MIRRLDDTTIGHIAAGEVVERPVSVVKELVENALDAGATRIAVAVARGGLDAIEVSDDGAGIAPAELPLALARHATSKLRASADLERIATLGFRGEGLASIAAVARTRVISRVAGAEVGYAIDAFGIDIGEPEPVAAPPGTRAVVRDLFANVPARREYLRTPPAEFGRISTFLATLALAYPEVGFSLAHDGRSAFVFAPGAAFEQRLAYVFGSGSARELLALAPSAASAYVRDVRGYASRPGSERGDRRMQFLFVNGRLLRTTSLAGAWNAAYSGFTLTGRQPYGVLFVDVPPDHVDPNVHPQKSDVRFRFPSEVASAVRRTLAATLTNDASARTRGAFSLAPTLAREHERDARDASGATESEARAAAPFFAFEIDERPRPRILAQLDDTYLLASDGRTLLLVDQHAAHERIAYETIVERARSGAAIAEPLLVPYAIELDAAQAERFERVRETLAAAGLESEPFGDRAYRIVATPAGYGARAFRIEPYLDDVDDEIAGLSAEERVWATLACHSVVRAGDPLEPAEMQALVERLLTCANPMHCPHGRPTIVRLEPADLARMFKRL